MQDRCSICNSQDIYFRHKYSVCHSCGYEEITINIVGVSLINDKLTLDQVVRLDSLEKFKTKLVKKCTMKWEYLVDIGSASGKFLWHNHSRFNKYCGVEVTPESFEFSRDTLHLRVVNDISLIEKSTISVATFWHSLEHIELVEIDRIFALIRFQSDDKTRIIVSVPNANSILYILFGQNYAYYDSTSHVHQFSPISLNLLFKKYGFVPIQSYPSFAYSSFGCIQTILNLFNTQRNFLYLSLKRGNKMNNNNMQYISVLFYSFALLLLLAPFIAPFMLFDVIFRKNAAVITTCYKKI